MILNRKSAKSTSKASLVIAITMFAAVVVTAQTQGIPTDYMFENGAQVCKAGLLDLFTKLLW
ncbi:MAG: hypothetical protein ABJI60_18255 [Kangiellaceae bacterium]|jgi:hypothetical protein